MYYLLVAKKIITTIAVLINGQYSGTTQAILGFTSKSRWRWWWWHLELSVKHV